MCFSATASFTSGIVLMTTGIFTLRHVRAKSTIPFASIPLLFGIQQMIEGVEWLTFASPNTLHTVTMYMFIIFAYVWWPIYVPMTIWLMEKKTIRKKILGIISLLWMGIGLYLLTCIVSGPVSSKILQHSIFYDVRIAYPILGFSLYFLATCGSTMISSSPKIQIFGGAMLLSFFLAHLLYPLTFFSVWCFFAAALSLIIYVHMRDLRVLFDIANKITKLKW